MHSFALAALLQAIYANAVLDPISTDRPAPAGGEQSDPEHFQLISTRSAGSIANDAPPNSFFAGHSPPYPTNDWWVGFAAGSGNAYVPPIDFNPRSLNPSKESQLARFPLKAAFLPQRSSLAFHPLVNSMVPPSFSLPRQIGVLASSSIRGM